MSEKTSIDQFIWTRILAGCSIVLMYSVLTGSALFEATMTPGEVLWSKIMQNQLMWGIPCLLMITGALLLDPERELLIPITNTGNVHLDDLVGYESQKKRLIENTEAFVAGRECNNVLLYGEAGTGKSTSVKAILNQYYDQGLRMIEIYKHQFQYLSKVISEIKHRNYRFVIYMDDLSFEETELEYKYLKAVIEGGLEPKPENVVIYATSNRRHLVRETWRDQSDVSSDDMHRNDTVEEKMSLANRFGVSIGYFKPDHEEFLHIVDTLVERYPQILLRGDELHRQAVAWSMRHGGRTGRTAQQFVTYLAGISEN